jgi:hypothetical protein
MADYDTPAAAAAAVLGHVGGHGLPAPGAFYQSLLAAMMRADPYHLARLTFVYPRLGDAVWAYRSREGGYETLCRLAGVEPRLEPWQPAARLPGTPASTGLS